MRILFNIASSYARYLLGLLTVAFLTPYIIRTVGMESFGLWSLCLALTGVLGLLDLGFSTAAVKLTAESAGNGDAERRNEALTTLFLVYALMGLLILWVLRAAIPVGIEAFDLDVVRARQFSAIMTITGSAIALGLPLSLFRSALVGQGRFDVVNGVDVLVTAVNAGLIILLLESGLQLKALAWANVFMVLGPSLVLVPLAFRLIPGLAITPRRLRFDRLRETAPLAVWFLMANMALMITLRSDAVLVKAFLSLSAVAAFAIAAKVSEFTYLLNKQFSNALMPLVSRLHGSGNRDGVRDILQLGTRYLVMISLPVIALLIFHAERLILAWVGPDMMPAVTPLRILLLAVFFSTLQFNAANVLGMLGAHRTVAWTMIGSAAANIGLTIILLPRLGLPGAALATLASALLIEFIIIFSSACRQQSLRPGTALRPVAAGVPALAILLTVSTLLARQWPPTSIADLFWHCLVAGGVYLVTAWFTLVRPQERAWLRLALTRRLRAVSSTSPKGSPA